MIIIERDRFVDYITNKSHIFVVTVTQELMTKGY